MRGPTNNNNNIIGNNTNDIITNNPPPKHHTKNILIIGSQGELGKTLVSHFGNQMNWNVVGADVLDPSHDAVQTSLQKKGLKEYIPLPQDGSVADLSVALYRGVSKYLSFHESSNRNLNHLDAIVCASGGWMGDVDKFTHQHSMMDNELLEDVDPDEEYIRESSNICERMMKVNYYPVVAGGMIGQRFLNGGTENGSDGSHTNDGLFVIIGASAALSPTPGMMGYGAAKAASHHYLQSYGSSVADENGSTSVGILPLMLDTPANRAMLGVGDDDDNYDDDRYSKMVKPIHIANEIGEWIKNPHLRPHSGSLVKVIAKNRMDGSGGAAFHLVR
jgi:dihydropteridine reductase